MSRPYLPSRSTLITTFFLLSRSLPIHSFQQPKPSYRKPPSLSSDFTAPGDDTYTLTTSDFEVTLYSDSTINPKEVLQEQQIATSKDGSNASPPWLDQLMNSYLGPRLLLGAVACLYGTNFPLGSIMDHALPASAATSARFVLAGLALSPFLFQLRKELIGVSLIAGCFTATGYVAQSLSLVDTSPATVSFLGAATVIWCPFLEWVVDKKPMGIHDRPQTWMAVGLCMLGVGILELCGSGVELSGHSGIGIGDGLALLQAVGFGTGLFMSEKMMHKYSDQALPITAVLVATTAFVSMGWAMADGWMWNTPNWESMTLPNMLLDPSMREVAGAVVWTGLLSTSLNFFLEVFSLQKVPSGEASVILATEPLWASAFAAVILGESFGWNDYVGGLLIVSACLVNCVPAGDIQKMLPFSEGQENESKQ